MEGAALQHSRFNHAVQDPRTAQWILYNFMTGKLVRLDPLAYGIYLNARQLPPQTPLLANLAKEGFLTCEDELAALRHATMLDCYDASALTLTICPTMACNFACPYCFENTRAGAMDKATQDALIGFIEQSVERFAFKRIFIVWFGGEPLLRPSIIESLSQRIIRIAEDHMLGYGAAIITNGWFLNRENARLLKRCRVKDIQITLDGPDPQTNDSLRRPKNGQGSFKHITENIKELPDGFRVKIRCNLGHHNIHMLEDMERLASRLNAECASDVYLVPGIMDMDVAAQAADESLQSSYQTIGRQLLRRGYLDQDIVGAKLQPYFTGTFCGSQNAHTYVVDELGNLYRCWEDCGNIERSFATVGNHGHFPVSCKMQNMTRYLDSAWPADDPQCSACKILPVCMGGCPHRFMESGIHRCPAFKEDLDGYVLHQAEIR